MQIKIRKDAKAAYLTRAALNREDINEDFANTLEKLQGQTVEVDKNWLSVDFIIAPIEGISRCPVIIGLPDVEQSDAGQFEIIDDERIGKYRCACCGIITKDKEKCGFCGETKYMVELSPQFQG